MQTVTKNTHEEFMALYLDYWMLMNVPYDYRVTKGERDFLVHTMVLNMNNVDINSRQYVKEMMQRLNLKRSNQVYVYRHTMKNLGYIVEDNNKLYLPSALNIKSVPQKSIFRFEVMCTARTNNIPTKPSVQKINKPLEQEVSMKDPVIQEPVQKERMDVVEKARTIKKQKPDVMSEVVENAYTAAKTMKRTTGYSDVSIDESTIERDRIKLPPMPDDSPVQVSKEKKEELDYKPSKNIIDLD